MSSLTVRRWGPESGMPEETFASIFAPGDGYVWLASNHGVVRFDGTKAQVFRLGDAFRSEGTGSCSSNSFNALRLGRDGSIWAGSASGCVFRILPDRFGTFANFQLQAIAPPSVDREQSTVISLHQPKEGPGVLVARRSQISRLDPPSAANATPLQAALHQVVPSPEQPVAESPPGLNLQFLAFDAVGRGWVALSDRGVYSLDPGQKQWRKRSMLPAIPRRLIIDAKGTVWIGTVGGLFRWRDGQLEHWDTRNGLPSNEVVGLREDQHGCIWMGFSQAVARMCGDRLESTPLGVAEEEIFSSLDIDPQGNVWLGGRWGNLYRLSRAIFRTYTRKEGLAESHLTGVAVDRQGSIYGSLRSSGIVKIQDGQIVAALGSPELELTQTLLAHPVEGVLAATPSNLLHVTGKGVRAIQTDVPIQLRALPAMFEEDADTILYSNLGGHYRLRRQSQAGKGELWKVEVLSGTTRLRQWAKDPRGTTWAIAQYEGLHVLDGTTYRPAPNAPRDRVRSWYSIYADKAGLLWIGTTEGVDVYSTREKRFLPKAPLLGMDHVFHITQDRFGKMWCATRQGLVRFSRAQALESIEDGGASRLQVERFGEAQSLPTTNFGLVTSASGASDVEGRLWFPGLLGLVSLDPAEFERKPRAPQPVLLSMNVDGNARDLSREDAIAPGAKKLEFEFQTIRLDRLGGEFCRLRLIGFDPDWIACNESRSAQYTNLTPGQYELLIQTSSVAGQWNGNTLRLAFSMDSALYQRGWVQATAAFALIAMVVLVLWRRHAIGMRHTRELEAKVEERTVSLEQAMKDAHAASRAKMEFLATMSHEIRTPMNGVLGAVQILGESRLDEDQQKLVSVIRQSGEDLVGIVDDILSLSKVEAGKLALEKVVVVLPELCEHLVALFLPKAHAKGVCLNFILEPDTPERILSDPQRLRQILLNLVGNALKFTERGEVRLRVSASAKRDSISFLVEDTGTGIPSEKIPTLFDPFVQADSSTTRQFGGSGLGLAIVSRFVEAMQGSIEVESTVGQGSVFRIHLPLEVPDLPEAEPPEADIAKAEAAMVPPGLTVLLAEDNAVNQMLFQRMLLRLGCQVLTAKNGQEAIELACGNHVDIVLMDCQMPVLDGLEATRELRSMGGRFVDLPVIAITASAMNEDRQQCFAAGMNDFLSKPLIFASLEEKLMHWSKVGPVA